MSDKNFYTIDVKKLEGFMPFDPFGNCTKNDVQVKLKGTNGATDYIELTSWNDKKFRAGSNRTFYLG